MIEEDIIRFAIWTIWATLTNRSRLGTALFLFNFFLLNIRWVVWMFNLNIWLLKPTLYLQMWVGGCRQISSTLLYFNTHLHVSKSIHTDVPLCDVMFNKIICIKSHLNASLNDFASTTHHSKQFVQHLFYQNNFK